MQVGPKYIRQMIVLCWVSLQQMSLAVLETLPVQCNMCVSPYVCAGKVEERGFSLRAYKEEDRSLLEGFSHSWGLVDVPGAPDAPSWHVHKSAGVRGKCRGWLYRVPCWALIQFPIIKWGPDSFSTRARGCISWSGSSFVIFRKASHIANFLCISSKKREIL